MDVLPAAGDVSSEGDDGDDGSGDVEAHLHDVGPDDGGHAAFEGVEQSEGGDDADGEHVAGADGDGDDDGDGEDADAFSGGAGDEEEAGGGFMKRAAEAPVDELVGGEHLALKVAREKEHGDDDTSDHVADDDLQEAEVAGEGYSGDADDGERAGLGGDDGERDGPPGHAAVGEEVALQRLRCAAFFLAKAQAEERDPNAGRRR